MQFDTIFTGYRISTRSGYKWNVINVIIFFQELKVGTINCVWFQSFIKGMWMKLSFHITIENIKYTFKYTFVYISNNSYVWIVNHNPQWYWSGTDKCLYTRHCSH